jgi:multimeric flavodoxin WrbA
MKVFAINGSPNKVGSTVKLIEMILDVCSEAGAECEKVNLEDYNIDHCSGCNKCIKNGVCYRDDDFTQLKAKMMEADGIIIGSPYYDGKPTVQLMVFLDRLAISSSYYSHFSQKYIIGVSTSAVNNCKSIAKYCAHLGILGFTYNGIVSGLLYESTVTQISVKDIDSDEEIMERARKAGNKLIEDIEKIPVPLIHKIKRYALRKWVSLAVVKLLRKKDRIYNRFLRYCEDKGWIKTINKTE